jgi:hypothetical protein
MSLAQWYVKSKFALTRKWALKMESESKDILSLFLGLHIDGSLAEYEHGNRIHKLMCNDQYDLGAIFDHIHGLVRENVKNKQVPNAGMFPLELMFFLEYVHSSEDKESFVHMCRILSLKYNKPLKFLGIFIWLAGPSGLGKGLKIDWESFIFGCQKYGAEGHSINARDVPSLNELVGGGGSGGKGGAVGDNGREQGLLLMTCEEADIDGSDKDWGENGKLTNLLKSMITNQSGQIKSKGKDRKDAELRVALMLAGTNNVKLLNHADKDWRTSRRNWFRLLKSVEFGDNGGHGDPETLKRKKKEFWGPIITVALGVKDRNLLTEADEAAAAKLQYETAQQWVDVLKKAIIPDDFEIKAWPRQAADVEQQWSDLPDMLKFFVSLVPIADALTKQKLSKAQLAERYKTFLYQTWGELHKQNAHWKAINNIQNNRDEQAGTINQTLGSAMEKMITEHFPIKQQRDSMYTCKPGTK